MLRTFPPVSSGWDVDDVDSATDGNDETLLDLCARNGNLRAVESLIRCGAALDRGVLHTIVIESVRNPSKVSKLIEVYRVIVDNAVLWRCLKTNKGLCPEKESTIYSSMLRETMLHLTTLPCDDDKRNVIQRAIEIGAAEMLTEILNTRGVYKLDEIDEMEHTAGTKRIYYDVTDMIAANKEIKCPCVTKGNKIMDSQAFGEQKTFMRYRPHQSYLQHILDSEDNWKENDILKRVPLRQLTKPLIFYTQKISLIFCVLQIIYMAIFSYSANDACLMSTRFHLNLTSCSVNYTSTTLTDNLIVIIGWPLSLQYSYVLKAVLTNIVLINKHIGQRRARHDEFVKSRADNFITRMLLRNLSVYPAIAFSIATYAWVYVIFYKDDYMLALHVTAMVHVFG